MAVYKVDAEGVASLRKMSQELMNGVETIKSETSTLHGIVEDYDDTLGPHKGELLEVLEQIKTAIESRFDSIEDVSQILNDVADGYQEVIDDNPFDGSDAGSGGSRSFGSAGGSSGAADSVVSSLSGMNVAYNALQPFGRDRSSEEIVSRLGGGDRTDGSCSSLAFAYAGNRAGYDVLDFRDGDSRSYFSNNNNIQKICDLPGVESLVFRGTNDFVCVHDLQAAMAPGKEYYLATGLHAAVVRKNGEQFEYLELQSPYNNGWHPLNDIVLQNRFGCIPNEDRAYPNFLIDVDSLTRSNEFIHILGFINTKESEQMKGVEGHVR